MGGLATGYHPAEGRTPSYAACSGRNRDCRSLLLHIGQLRSGMSKLPNRGIEHNVNNRQAARSRGPGPLASTMDHRAGSPGDEPMAFNKRLLVFGLLWFAIVAVLMMIWLYGVAHHW